MEPYKLRGARTGVQRLSVLGSLSRGAVQGVDGVDSPIRHTRHAAVHRPDVLDQGREDRVPQLAKRVPQPEVAEALGLGL